MRVFSHARSRSTRLHVRTDDSLNKPSRPPLLARREESEEVSRQVVFRAKKNKTGAAGPTRASKQASDHLDASGLSTLIYQEKQIVRDNSPVASPVGQPPPSRPVLKNSFGLAGTNKMMSDTSSWTSGRDHRYSHTRYILGILRRVLRV